MFGQVEQSLPTSREKRQHRSSTVDSFENISGPFPHTALILSGSPTQLKKEIQLLWLSVLTGSEAEAREKQHDSNASMVTQPMNLKNVNTFKVLYKVLKYYYFQENPCTLKLT